MSTASQIPGTLNRFFACPASQSSSLYLLRVLYGTMQSSDQCEIKWESHAGAQGEAWSDGLFPHIYCRDGRLGLRGGEVEGAAVVSSEEGEEGWEGGLGRLRGWLV